MKGAFPVSWMFEPSTVRSSDPLALVISMLRMRPPLTSLPVMLAIPNSPSNLMLLSRNGEVIAVPLAPLVNPLANVNPVTLVP